MLAKFTSTNAPEMGKPVAALVTVPATVPGFDTKEKSTVVVVFETTIAPVVPV